MVHSRLCGLYDSAGIICVYREVGTIIRSLDCYPSEADLGDIISEVLYVIFITTITKSCYIAYITYTYIIHVHLITLQVEEEEPTGFVRYEKFEPVLCRILLERRYQPVNEEQLLKAFKVATCTVLFYNSALA